MYSTILQKFCTFSPFFFFLLLLFFYADWAIPREIPFQAIFAKLQTVDIRNMLFVNLSLLSQLKPIQTYIRNILVILVCPFRFLLSDIFETLYQQSSQERIVGIVRDLGDILLSFLCLLIFLCLLNTINYWPVSIDINVAFACIDYVTTVTSIIFSWSVLSL